jgi:uncharacterized protein YgiM (DUF1202 family)
VSGFWLLIVAGVLFCGIAALCSSLSSSVLGRMAAGQPPESKSTATAERTEVKIAVPVPVEGKMIEERVNLRAAPSTDAEVVGKLEKDAQITLIGRSEDGKWYQADIEGRLEGWVFGQTLEITSGDSEILPVVTLSP